MDAVESVLAVAVAALATLAVLAWIARSLVSERSRLAASTGETQNALVADRRVRQLDHLLIEIGLGFVLAAAGYVTLGVMPA